MSRVYLQSCKFFETSEQNQLCQDLCFQLLCLPFQTKISHFLKKYTYKHVSMKYILINIMSIVHHKNGKICQIYHNALLFTNFKNLF